jgi:hypothetical protein
MSEPAIVHHEPVRRRGAQAIAKVQELLSIDARSLGLLRIGLATLVLIDLIQRAGDLQAHYTDFGVLPSWAAPHILSYHLCHWSLHLASGTWQWQAFLFVVAGGAAIAMLAGYQTRWATIITWALLASLHTRHPLVLNGGDHLLRMLLFWSIFLPTGTRFSLDRRLSHEMSAPKSVFSAASVAIMLQLCLIYWVSAATKTDAQWTENRWALYYALNIDQISTGFAKWLLGYPELLRWLTAATLWLEWWGPVLLFVPFYTARIRTLVILLFVGFHLGIGLCMELGLFPWISIVGWSVFLPGRVWDRLEKAIPLLPKSTSQPHAGSGPGTAAATLRSSVAVNILVSLLAVYVLIFSLQVVYPARFGWFDQRWKSVGYALGLEQRFDLFAPKPTIIDGWFVTVATLDDGSQVDLLQDGAMVRWEKPEMLSARYPNGHWGAYMFFLKEPKEAATIHRPFYVEYLKRAWRQRYGGQKKIRKVELYLVLELTPPYPQAPKPERILLFRDKPRYDRVNYFQVPIP